LLEINEFLDSSNEKLIEIGLFLYRRNNGENGLSREEVYNLIKMINELHNEDKIGELLDKEYVKGYDAGFEDAKKHYEDSNYDSRVEVVKDIDFTQLMRK
jgi:hypothetical protein